MTNIQQAITALDFFTKFYCIKEYEPQLEFRCDECLFKERDSHCLVKKMKSKYWPDYEDFGSMAR